MTAALHAPRTHAWPMERRDGLVLVAWFVGLLGIWWGAGALLTGPLDGSWIVRTDERISQWFADGRTPTYDDLATVGAMLADTFVKIGVTAVAAVVIFARWRSWRDVLMIVVPLVLEATTFIVVTFLVGRPRPDVPRLEDSPVDSSWPSGHVAAAVVYSAIAVGALLLNVLLNLILTSAIGIVGASLASSIAYAVLAMAWVGWGLRIAGLRLSETFLPQPGDRESLGRLVPRLGSAR